MKTPKRSHLSLLTVSSCQLQAITSTRRHLSVGSGELGHGLAVLRHGVLGELSGKEQSHGGLDLAGGKGGFLVAEPIRKPK
jgi:hypothetical protein